MDRRNFLKTGTLAIGAGLAPRSFAIDENHPSSHGPSIRRVFPLNRNWRYSPKLLAGIHDPDFDDSSFERVVIPHTNVRLPWHSFDEKAYQFVSVYRRRFRLPPETRGQHIFIDFEGVMSASTVWINGVRIGEYQGGYTPFSFELSPHVNYEAENLLVVEVDSTERPDIPPFGDLIDYLTFGGIYREVSLRIVPSTFIDNIFVRPQEVLSSRPALEVDCFIQTLSPLTVPLTLEVKLSDTDHVVAQAIKRVSVLTDKTPLRVETVRIERLNSIKLSSFGNCPTRVYTRCRFDCYEKAT
jgi:beta-galactosidase